MGNVLSHYMALFPPEFKLRFSSPCLGNVLSGYMLNDEYLGYKKGFSSPCLGNVLSHILSDDIGSLVRHGVFVPMFGECSF